MYQRLPILDTTESAPTGTSSIGTPWSWLEGIPEEEESSVKDSVTFGLPLKIAKGELQKPVGSGELLMPLLKVNAHDGEDIVIEKKMAPVLVNKPKKKGSCLWVPW